MSFSSRIFSKDFRLFFRGIELRSLIPDLETEHKEHFDKSDEKNYGSSRAVFFSNAFFSFLSILLQTLKVGLMVKVKV